MVVGVGRNYDQFTLYYVGIPYITLHCIARVRNIGVNDSSVILLTRRDEARTQTATSSLPQTIRVVIVVITGGVDLVTGEGRMNVFILSNTMRIF